MGLITSHNARILFCSSTIIFLKKTQKISNNAGAGGGEPDPSAILSLCCTDKAASIFGLDMPSGQPNN